MNLPLLQAFSPPSFDQLEKALQDKHTIALTGLPDGQAAFVASCLAERTHKRILLVQTNDLKAGKAADDLQQLVSVRSAWLPGGEIDLTRGVSSQETEWRRLETLSHLTADDVQVLTVSMDALMQRMGNPRLFRAGTVFLKTDDRYAQHLLVSHLLHMGYERTGIVEGKGQFSLKGSVLDVYPPSSTSGFRIEFFDDIVDSIRSFDAISQRSLERLHECVIPPANEIILSPDDAPEAAARMRKALNSLRGTQSTQESQKGDASLFDDLPPLPESDEELPDYFDEEVAPKIREQNWSVTQETEIERRREALLGDADLVEQGLPFRRIRAWAHVLLPETFSLTDWFHPDLIMLCEPDSLRERCRERSVGFSEDLATAIERGEAVPAQEHLFRAWDDISQNIQEYTCVTVSDLTRSMAGLLSSYWRSSLSWAR